MVKKTFTTAIGHCGDMFFMKRHDKIIKIFYDKKKCEEYTDAQNEDVLNTDY